MMSALVTSARKYLGVKFRHRGRTPRGMDCAGLVWLALSDIGKVMPDFRLYGTEPHEGGLVRYVEAALGAPTAVAPVRAVDLQEGCVVVMRYEHEPHHIAIVTKHPLGHFAILHADGWEERVLEQGLAPDMVARITHVFQEPV